MLMKRGLSFLLAAALLISIVCIVPQNAEAAGTYESVVSRNDGIWYWPVGDAGSLTRVSDARVTDWCGCHGGSYAKACPFHGSSCLLTCGADHTLDPGHNGMDCTGNGYGTTVYAARKGTVAYVSENDSPRGYYVVIEHPYKANYAYYSVYQHLSQKSSMTVGAHVDAGTAIGFMGGSGNGQTGAYGAHLHFGIILAEPGLRDNSLSHYNLASYETRFVTGADMTGMLNVNPSYSQMQNRVPEAGPIMDGCSANIHCGSVSYTRALNRVPDSSSYVASCVYYPCYLQVEVCNKTTIKTLPCSKSTDSNSKDVDTVSKGTLLTVIGLYKNTANNYWYEVATNDSKGICYSSSAYVYGGDIGEKYYPTDWGLSVPGSHRPTQLSAGSPFAVTGAVISQYMHLSSAGVQIYRGSGVTSGNAVTGYLKPLSGVFSCALTGEVDDRTAYNCLDRGQYTYTVKASIKGYYTQTGKDLHEYTINDVLVDWCNFSVS